jgi:hypothetical protein
MEIKAIALFLISLIALFASFAYSFFYPIDNFFSAVPITLLVLGFFLMGTALYGILAFVPHVFFGLTMGTQKNALIFIYIFPILIATYAGILLGTSLMDDFNLKKYFLKDGKKVLFLLATAIIMAFAIEVLLPIALTTKLWPEDIFGLHTTEGKSFTGVLSELTKMITQR